MMKEDMLLLLKKVNKSVEEFLASLNVLEIDDILLENAIIKIEIIQKEQISKKQSKKIKNTPSKKEKKNIVLNDVGTKEQGYKILDGKKKSELVKIAKDLDLAVKPKDTVKKIKEKIVEATIGYRLDTEAILRK